MVIPYWIDLQIVCAQRTCFAENLQMFLKNVLKDMQVAANFTALLARIHCSFNSVHACTLRRGCLDAPHCGQVPRGCQGEGCQDSALLWV